MPKETESPTQDAKMISKEELLKLLKKTKSADSHLQDAKTDLSTLVANAVEKHNLHKGAFALCRKLSKYDPVKLYAFLQHLDAYREHLELDKQAGQSLDDAAGEGTKAAKAKAAGKRGSTARKGDEGDGQPGGGTVTSLDGARKAASANKD